MSHVFSNSPQGSGKQYVSADEAKQLIRIHQNRDAALQGSVTTQDLAEALGLPTWQVEQMVNEMRTKRPSGVEPMPGSVWLKTRLWIWALAACFVVSIVISSGSIGGMIDDMFSRGGPGLSLGNRVEGDGIYSHRVAERGREFGMKAPPGFSYKIKYGVIEAAANGDSKHYISSKDVSEESLGIIQEQYTNMILDGFDKAIKSMPPEWINGQAVGEVRPNYYDAGYADPFDFVLKKAGFPYKPGTNPVSKEMHDKLLADLKEHWEDIMD